MKVGASLDLPARVGCGREALRGQHLLVLGERVFEDGDVALASPDALFDVSRAYASRDDDDDDDNDDTLSDEEEDPYRASVCLICRADHCESALSSRLARPPPKERKAPSPSKGAPCWHHGHVEAAEALHLPAGVPSDLARAHARSLAELVARDT